MGRPKQVLPLAGRPLLQHVVDAAAGAGLAEIIVVLGHAADEVRRAVTLPSRGRFVVNDDWMEGQSASLACGLASASTDAAAAVVLLGDQPHVTSALVDRMIAAFCVADTPAVRPTWRGADGALLPGHPVVLARSLWRAVSALDGDRGARALFAEHPDWLSDVAVAGAPLPDVDDLDDYLRLADGAATATGG
jgi:molybdenum cofactor cytidylyltransferase